MEIRRRGFFGSVMASILAPFLPLKPPAKRRAPIELPKIVSKATPIKTGSLCYGNDNIWWRDGDNWVAVGPEPRNPHWNVVVNSSKRQPNLSTQELFDALMDCE